MMKLCVIDTETGGLNPLRHSILSLGAVVWQSGCIVDTFEVFVREPEIVTESEAMKVNGIDLEWLRAHGLSPSDAVSTFHSFLARHFNIANNGRALLVGHNVAFDVAFFARLYELAGSAFDQFFSHRVLDTASVVNFLIVASRLPLSEASSNKVFAHFGISFGTDGRHTALGDAIATSTLLTELIKLVK